MNALIAGKKPAGGGNVASRGCWTPGRLKVQHGANGDNVWCLVHRHDSRPFKPSFACHSPWLRKEWRSLEEGGRSEGCLLGRPKC